MRVRFYVSRILLSPSTLWWTPPPNLYAPFHGDKRDQLGQINGQTPENERVGKMDLSPRNFSYEPVAW